MDVSSQVGIIVGWNIIYSNLAKTETPRYTIVYLFLNSLFHVTVLMLLKKAIWMLLNT